ncbi:MAG: helix-turn-helix domain-containing protein [Clostridiales bacterium]|jgi:transcriptional regulator with XRE-family HTH domain|nr:helix-turn-helix domain-containing protein [Clostridiales bacterium]
MDETGKPDGETSGPGKEKAQRGNDKSALAEEIAGRIKTLANSRGMSVRGVLIEMGIHLNFVNGMKKNGTIPGADAFLPIANYFGTSIDYLLGVQTEDTEIALLLYGFKEMLTRQGLNDKSFKLEVLPFYFEWIEKMTHIFVEMYNLKPKWEDDDEGAYDNESIADDKAARSNKLCNR